MTIGERAYLAIKEKAEEKGIKIYKLNIGQPDLPTPQKALDVLGKIDRTTSFKYRYAYNLRKTSRHKPHVRGNSEKPPYT